MSIKYYEDVAFSQARKKAAQLDEIYRGADMADWWGSIQRVLKKKISDYSQKEGKEREIRELSTFKQAWDSNPIGGSVSKSTLRLLATAANQASSHEDTEVADLFSHIRDNLNRVIASKEELPAVPSSTGKDLGAGGPPMMGNFGAEKEPPSPSGLTQDPLAQKDKAANELKAAMPTTPTKPTVPTKPTAPPKPGARPPRPPV